MKKLLLTIVAALSIPMAAQAVTINIGDMVREDAALAVDGTLEFVFEAGSDLSITNLEIAGQGQSAGLDVGGVTYTLAVNTVEIVSAEGFQSILAGSTLGLGLSNLADVVLSAGDTLAITFFDGIAAPVDIDVAFDVTPISLPATGGMLLTGLVAVCLLARRKEKRTA